MSAKAEARASAIFFAVQNYVQRVVNPLAERISVLEAATGVKSAPKQRIKLRGIYAEGKSYSENDAVMFGGAWFKCTRGPTTISPPSEGVWRKL